MALKRHVSLRHGSFSPAAIRNCHSTSQPGDASVTGCSTGAMFHFHEPVAARMKPIRAIGDELDRPAPA